MTLDSFIGNQDAVKALEGMVSTGRIPHAMMLYENDGCGALALALAFLGELFHDGHRVGAMIHPDIHFVYPVANGTKVNEKVESLRSILFLRYWRELMAANPYALANEVDAAFGIQGKLTAINNAQAKEILETVYLSPVEGGYKAVVVYLPEKMNASSANRLLKAVEEPPEKTVFIMVTHAPEKVLQTISSRCQALRVHPLSKEDVVHVLTEQFGKDEQLAREAAESAGGSVGTALRTLTDNEASKSQDELFINMMNSLSGKDLSSLLECADSLAALPSRESQKAFCRYAGESLRKIFLLQQGLENLVNLTDGQKGSFPSFARKMKKSFPRLAMGCLDKAQMMLDRNVNQKILFYDLVGQMFSVI